MSVHVQIFGEVVFLSPGSEENWGFFQFGTTGDVPLPGDFDGDRRADYAFFRPSNATWYIQQSTLGYRTALFGLANDKLVPLDYDGDGTTDFGVFRPSTGLWFTAPSAESNPGQHYTSFLFGQNGDIPSPGDYDGDGKYDRSVFRPSDGTWWVLRSSDSTYYQVSFGLASDHPIPSEYLP